jgi:adenosylcobinamide kinase/adenosylcobinamide-phosphate guanylyltransferase
LTLWVSNLLIQRDDKYASEKVDDLIDKLPQLNFHLVFVTNEVGWGIVPDNSLARKFRDLAGWTNQRMAQAANEVILMVAGVPMIAKKGAACS